MRLLPLVAALTVALVGCGVAGSAKRVTSVWVSTSGSDSAACTQSAPCATFDRAYHVAQPGDTVSVVAGTYQSQQISADSAKAAGSTPVTFAPAAGGAVDVQGNIVVLGAHDVRVTRMTAQQIAVLPSTRSAITSNTVYASNITFSQMGIHVFVFNASANVTLQDSAVGNYSYTQGYGSNTVGSYEQMPPSTNILIDRVVFRGITRDTSPSHAECLFLQNVDGVVIRRSKFLSCPVMAIFSQAVGNPLNPQHVTIENNFIGHPGDGGSSSIYVDYRGGTPPTNWQIRFNSLGGGMRFADGSSFPGITVSSNIGPNTEGYCGDQVAYDHNVWTGIRCGATDKIAPLPYVNTDGLDYRLLRCTAPLGAGNAASFPKTDIAGTKRPQGKLPDAGAWEAPVAKKPKPKPCR